MDDLPEVSDIILLYNRIQAFKQQLHKRLSQPHHKSIKDYAATRQYIKLHSDVGNFFDDARFDSIAPPNRLLEFLSDAIIIAYFYPVFAVIAFGILAAAFSVNAITFIGSLIAILLLVGFIVYQSGDTLTRTYEKIEVLEQYSLDYADLYYPGIVYQILQTKGSAEEHIANIRHAIEASSIEDVLKDIAVYDLEQARAAYEAGAFKACVVMLGAVLEGIMLGTLRRPDVLSRIRTGHDIPKAISRVGLRNRSDSEIGESIAEDLRFDDYKTAILYLMPEIERLKVENIQTFRNAVHPWRTVKESNVYGNPDVTRVINHLTSLEILARHILSWVP